MLAIDNTLISEDIFDKYFCCPLDVCHGHCCVEGDAGAPLEEEEISIIEDYMHKIAPYLTPESRRIIAQKGVFDYDAMGNLVTPLVNKKECVFAIFENNTLICAIEKAFLDKKIDFPKPVSCHLYPIRIENHQFYHVLQYERWYVCQDAEEKGKALGLTVFDFLQIPLKRRFGEEWVEKIKIFLQHRTTL